MCSNVHRLVDPEWGTASNGAHAAFKKVVLGRGASLPLRGSSAAWRGLHDAEVCAKMENLRSYQACHCLLFSMPAVAH